jgi:thiol-disulfide isomerase/thioredoxin
MGKRTVLRLQREQQKRNSIIAIVVGVGIMALGVFALTSAPRSNANAGGGQSLSAIPVAVNYPAPELSLQNINGNTEALIDFRDKVLLINNWATWCPPCKAEMPTLVTFYNQHAADGLMIIAVEAGESKNQVQAFVDQFQMPFHVWLDPNGDSGMAFKNNNLPNSYVIDRTGTVRLMWTGEISQEMLEKYVTPLLVEN